MSKEVAVKKDNAIVPGSWRERAMADVSAAKGTLAKLPTGGGSFVSFRNGILSVGGTKVPSPLPIILLASGFERVYYSKAFEQDQRVSPDCYSYDGVSPHPESKVPQADECRTCRWNAFGSRGKGKACKEGARFAFITADAAGDPERVRTDPIWQGKLSVMNTRVFADFAGAKAAANKPLWQGVTLMHCEPDSKTQYAVTWRSEDVVMDDDTMDAIAARAAEAAQTLVEPYPDFDADGDGAGKRKF
jgi:hypothetical protein